MLFLLSPAKSLNESRNYTVAAQQQASTQPLFLAQSAQLIALLQQKSVAEIAALLKISPKLAQLNLERYQAWQQTNPPQLSYPAICLFNGDVYEGLDVASLDAGALTWLQQSTVILSGLYAAVRPFDQIQPYRLEMGTKLANAGGSNLYQFWNQQVTNYLNQQLQPSANKVVVNLASQEYSKVIKPNLLQAQLVDCVFEDWKNQQYKIISFYAKRARGLMLRFAALNQVTELAQLQGFNLAGYSFVAEVSTANKLVFRRKQADN